MGSRNIMNHVVVCSENLYTIIAAWECTPVITSPNYKFVLHNGGIQAQYNLYCIEGPPFILLLISWTLMLFNVAILSDGS